MIVNAKIHFQRCLQNMQDYGTNDEFMVSRVFYSVELPNRTIPELSVEVKQTAGDSFERGSIEVGSPEGTSLGKVNYLAFRDAVETYYRSLVGKQSHGIHVKGSASIIMRNNMFEYPMTVEIPIDTESGGW